jgi:Xaa-Pro aminopeptidase
MPEAVLLYGDTERSADLFHAIPVVIIDPFLYVEIGDRRVAVESVIERDRIIGLGTGVEVLDVSSLGREELLKQGKTYHEADLETTLRACRELGVESAVVPAEFPVAMADHLRANGIALRIDPELFEDRRRVKTPHQIAGIRRAQAAADASMAEAARLLRELPDGVSSESIRTAMQAVCRARGCTLDDGVIVARGEQAASGHESGFGPITRGDLVLIDIWPRDSASRCYADMTRTFVAGGEEPDAELAEYWRLCKAALDVVLPEVRPGVNGRELYARTAEVFEAAGQLTQRNKPEGEILTGGFNHSLGHGVGIDIHEAPGMGLSGHDLVAGDVITLEPGCYRKGYGGCRLEDLVLVTEDGAEVLTNFPYELAP